MAGWVRHGRHRRSVPDASPGRHGHGMAPPTADEGVEEGGGGEERDEEEGGERDGRGRGGVEEGERQREGYVGGTGCRDGWGRKREMGRPGDIEPPVAISLLLRGVDQHHLVAAGGARGEQDVIAPDGVVGSGLSSVSSSLAVQSAGPTAIVAPKAAPPGQPASRLASAGVMMAITSSEPRPTRIRPQSGSPRLSPPRVRSARSTTHGKPACAGSTPPPRPASGPRASRRQGGAHGGDHANGRNRR